jgi:hypothetical protein
VSADFDESPFGASFLPSLFPDFARAGGLPAYGPPNLLDMYRQSVVMTANDTKPARLQIEWPTNLQSVLDLKAAKVLGITDPYASSLACR